MKIRFVTPYFPPEVGAPQTRIYELAVRLCKAGHEVSVITTFPNYPTGVVPKEWRGKLWWKGLQDGITIWRFWSYAAANRGFARRLTTHLTFAGSSASGGLLLPQCDVMIVESPPLFDGFSAVVLSTLRRTPYAFMVSDLWPESAVQMGMIRNKSIIRASKWLELYFYRHAELILGLTRGICDKINADGVPSDKIELFRNSVDCDFFRPGLNSGPIRREFKIDDHEFVAVYAGTLGLAQGLSTVLHAAALIKLKTQARVRFVLAGNGAESEKLRYEATRLGLSNVLLIDSLSKARMPELLNAADCILVPLRDLEIFRGALPTKMFEGMACAKPLVLGVQGEAKDLVEGAAAGYCVKPGSPEAICSAVLSLAANPEKARQMGENGRRLVLTEFSREARTDQLAGYLSRIAGKTQFLSNALGHQLSPRRLKSLIR